MPWGLMPSHHLPMDEAVANSVKEEPSSGKFYKNEMFLFKYKFLGLCGLCAYFPRENALEKNLIFVEEFK